MVLFFFVSILLVSASLQRYRFPHQGLGLLINLVEYSSRNRHCLVDMDYVISEGCLDDSSLAPPAVTASAGPGGEEPAAAAPCDGEPPADDAADKPPATGALAALVKVRVPS